MAIKLEVWIDRRIQIMELFSYILLVTSLAVHQSLDVSQTILFVALIGAGLIARFYPRHNMTLHMSGWQAASIVLGGVILTRVLLAPYWAYEDLKEQNAIIVQKLAELGTDRPFDFVKENISVQESTSGNGVTVSLAFENKGDKAIEYTIKKIYLTINGRYASVVPDFGRPVFVPGHALRAFTFPTIFNVNLTLPLILTFGWIIDYDNVPPVSKRTTERDLQDEIISYQPVVNFNHIIREEEK